MQPIVTFRVRNNVDLKLPVTLKKRVADNTQASGYRLDPVNLTGAALVMDVRDQDENLKARFTTADGTILITDALLGKIQFEADKAFMLDIPEGQWSQDLVMIIGAGTTGVWRGLFEVTDGQTRP